MIARCETCGAGFPRAAGETWKRLCLPCWRRNKARTESARYETRNAAPESVGAVLDAGRIRQLLQLTHPDRHGGSELAHEVTTWLLQQRAQLRGATR